VRFSFSIAVFVATFFAGAVVLGPAGAQTPATPGCDPARAHAPGDSNETIDSGGFTRDYILHVPPSYTGSEPMPLVLLFHGLGMSHDDMHDYTELFDLGDAEGFVLAVPSGTVGPILATEHWNFLIFLSELSPEEPDDIGFVGDLLDSLEADLCIDPTRVFATGISNGAMMSVRLACDLSDRIAAIGAISGVYYPPFSPDLPQEPGCLGERPVPLMATHGTSDDVIPYQGGPLGLEIPVSVRHVENEVLPKWAAHNGCSGGVTTEPVSANVDLLDYGDCAGGATTQLYRIEGGDHVWPGASETFQEDPDVNDEIDANTLLWQFFEAHPLVQQVAPTPTTTGPADDTGPVSSPTQPARAATTAPAALPSAGGGSQDGMSLAWLAVLLASAGALSAAAWWLRSRSRP
jgi:polyhydroxybutyrate depolymerase